MISNQNQVPSKPRLNPCSFARAAFLIVVSVTVLFFFMKTSACKETVLYEKDSLYHHIRVSEENGVRYLSFNRRRGSQSKVNIHNPNQLLFSYTKAVFLSLAFLPKPPQRVLLLGLGGGSIPKAVIKYLPSTRIDVVEIDRDVVYVAKKYFFLRPANTMIIVVQDGRQFLRRGREKYDLILLDAYNDAAIPFHLTTKEFYQIVQQKLNPHGVMAANIWGPSSNDFFQSQIKTCQQVFPHLYTIHAISTNNYIFVGTSSAFTQGMVKKRARALHKRYKFSFSLDKYSDTFDDVTTRFVDADVLLDDFAPVELLRSRKVSP